MTSNRFLLQASDYDSKYEFRVADLTRVEKTIEDFWNEKAEVYDYFEYLYYLSRNKAFLTMEEANKIFNGLHEENKELRHKLSQQEMEYATTAYKQAEENDLLRVENEDMRRLMSNISYQRDEFSRGARENANRVGKLKKENEQLKQKVDFYKYFQKDARELEKENEQLKEEIKGLNDILARYEEKELKERIDNEKSCGHCKHFEVDGMFGMWCEKGRSWENTDANCCSDYEKGL